MSILNFWKHHGILGINARNLLYHLPLNTREAIRMADDKLKTKSFLSARNIITPRLLGKITTPEEIQKFNYDSLPNTFVIKPNAGYGGEGIIPLQRNPDTKHFQKLNGTPYTLTDLQHHLADILEGRYSLGGLADTAFFEQKLELDHTLTHLTPAGGLPDIRIIFYNQIPIMAMLRLPTRASGGKANTHLGGIGLGIDLATGKTTHAVQYNKYINKIPEVGTPTGHLIPGFQDMLLMGSRIQSSISLGYLATDFVPDENTGPTLLEINARAGLMVQLANRAPLRKRLNQIKGLRPTSAEKAVQIGQDLFGETPTRTKKQKTEPRPIIGLTEEIELLLPHGSKKILARISPNSDTTYLSEKILKQLKLNQDEPDTPIKFILGGERQRAIPTPKHFEGKYQMIIGTKNLHNVLIDPRKPEPTPKNPTETTPPPTPTPRETLTTYDHQLTTIEEKISLLHYLRPTNLETQKKKFLKNPTHNPHFTYRPLKFDATQLLTQLNQIYIDPSLPHTRLFLEKKKEIKHKLQLLLTRGTPDFTTASHELYGTPDPNTLTFATEKMQDHQEETPTTATITSAQLTQTFTKELKKLNLTTWQATETKMVADCTVSPRKQKILIRRGATFTPHRVQKLLLHEFHTHVLTTVNGQTQPYQLLRLGTPLFLETQEGLAIYNQTHFTPQGTDPTGLTKAALAYFAAAKAQTQSFTELFTTLKKLGYSDELSWQLTLKTKRGLTDTSQPGGFTKDLLYIRGYLQIADFVKHGGDLHRLYIGKLNLRDLDQIETLPGIQPPRYTPPFLNPHSIR